MRARVDTYQDEGRVLVVGDVHGCLDELKELLSLSGFRDSDRLLSVGDIIDRGPKIPQTVDFLRSLPKFGHVIGNHEYSLFQHEMGKKEPSVYLKTTLDAYGGKVPMDVLEFLGYAPFILDAWFGIVVHAGLRHENGLDQDVQDCMRMRFAEDGSPWYSEWPEKAHRVVFGHTPDPGWRRDGNVISLDGGCVHGGWLLGYDPKESKVYYVKSRGEYFPGDYYEKADKLALNGTGWFKI
jgi:hypothetical protein